jgi:hypothetical protein
MIYELIQTEESKVVKRTDENGVVSFIPTDIGNADYQEYLAQLEKE